jgi:hypothetical protein
MTHSASPRSFSSLWLIALLLFAGTVYLVAVPRHPPGFYIDESSIAYNAYLIAQTGRDEYGERFPLYFRAFGDYKNPTYIYLLALVFKVVGPGISAARQVSAIFGAASGLLLGLLAWNLSRKTIVATVVATSALLTPWLYESSRLVFEVAIYPFITVLFLLAVWRASQNKLWRTSDVVNVAASLALLTYSYSTGRLLAPLLAVGLMLFIRRHGWPSIVKTWFLYLISLIPLVLYGVRHPGALQNRFMLLTYIGSNKSALGIASDFLKHFFVNLSPWHWLVTGENNVRDHVSGFGALLVATVILGIAGLVAIWRAHRHKPWWQFIVYGLLVSVIPASLTNNLFPQLRLITFPVFFNLLLVPSLDWLTNARRDGPEPNAEPRRAYVSRLSKRAVLLLLIAMLLLQGIYFQKVFHETAGDRWYVFDARFPNKVLAVALQTGQKPIYLYDRPGNSGYVQAYWYAVLNRIDTSQFVRLDAGVRPPPGALVISTEEDCKDCRLLAKSINYTLYSMLPSSVAPSSEPLSSDGFRARIRVENPPSTLKAGTKATLSVLVKNLSSAVWPALGEADTNRNAVGLRDRWIASDGRVNESDDRIRFPYDLEPGDTAGVHLEITAPEVPGKYRLQLDVVQEGVAWFSDRGSDRFELLLSVEP